MSISTFVTFTPPAFNGDLACIRSFTVVITEYDYFCFLCSIYAAAVEIIFVPAVVRTKYHAPYLVLQVSHKILDKRNVKGYFQQL